MMVSIFSILMRFLQRSLTTDLNQGALCLFTICHAILMGLSRLLALVAGSYRIGQTEGFQCKPTALPIQ